MTPAHAQAAEALLRSALEPNLEKHMGGEELSRASQASPCKWHHSMCIAPTCTGAQAAQGYTTQLPEVWATTQCSQSAFL